MILNACVFCLLLSLGSISCTHLEKRPDTNQSTVTVEDNSLTDLNVPVQVQNVNISNVDSISQSPDGSSTGGSSGSDCSSSSSGCPCCNSIEKLLLPLVDALKSLVTSSCSSEKGEINLYLRGIGRRDGETSDDFDVNVTRGESQNRSQRARDV